MAEIAPRTAAALGKILDEVFGPGATPPARALDLGAGTGAAGAVLRARFGEGLDIVSVDKVAAPGILVADLERGLPADGRSELGRFDLIVAAHVLNELYAGRDAEAQSSERAARVLAWCRTLLAVGGTVILLEPALRETSRALLSVRDRLLAAGLHVVAPCFWTGPCPALGRERDWCHDAAKVPSAPRVDFSYLVLRTEPSAEASTNLYRVVSDRLVEKGRLKIFACGSPGRQALVRLDRVATEANAEFDRLERGDAVSIAGPALTAQGDGAQRLSADTKVAKRRA
ncbi:MAG: Ribosomal small subunit Rsm22 [Myxococcales bacterium]|nr:Ribosomal small subunit Rsm22 [Myxococcales bacterium]